MTTITPDEMKSLETLFMSETAATATRRRGSGAQAAVRQTCGK